MTDQLISYETAKLAKEKGFDNNNEIYHFEDIKIIGIFTTQSLLQNWLREKHNIHLECSLTMGLQYSFTIYKRLDKWHYTEVNNYEEALEEALQEALKLIII